MNDIESIVFSCNFGSVTNKRVILNGKKGADEFPIRAITSASFRRQRNYIRAILGFLFAIGCVVLIGSGNAKIGLLESFIIVVFLLFGLLVGFAHWIGHHNLVVGVSGIDRKPIKVEISKTAEGRTFVEEIKKAIIY
jgi:hypothetical protein